MSTPSPWPFLLGVGLVAFALSSARRQDARATATVHGPDPDDREAVVDEWGEESFPASDPPASY